FADDGEAEPGPFLLFARAAPEPFENVLPILPWHAAAAIGHLDPAATIDRHGHFRSRRGVNDRVRNFSSSPFPSIVSRAEVMIASGVRSSWAALAVNSRCTAKPFSSRSSA